MQTTVQPRDGGTPFEVRVTANPGGSGWDVVLFIDHTGDRRTDRSGWMLELAVFPDVTADGLFAVTGQITSRPGGDALAIFASYPDSFEVTNNTGGRMHTVTADERTPI
jgi:hypothetical protein